MRDLMRLLNVVRAVFLLFFMVAGASIAAAQGIYVVDNGAKNGPFERAELEERAADGRLTGDTLVWMEGMPDWAPAKEVPEVAALLAPPEPEVPTAVQIYLLEDGSRTGPHDRQTVQERVDRGIVTGKTLVWTEGMTGWEPLEKEAERLQITVTAKPAPPPPPPPPPNDWVGFLAGTWDMEPVQAPLEGVGMATLTGVTIFDRRGAFTMTGEIIGSSAYGPVTFYRSMEGTFKAQDVGDGKFKLSVDGTMTLSPPAGATIAPQVEPMKNTVILEAVDDNTLRNVQSGEVSRRRLR